MTNYYWNADVVGGNDDGTGWDDAWSADPNTALDLIAAGDTLFMKGDWSKATTLYLSGGASNNLKKIIGCKQSASSEPPAASEVIDDYNDADIPVIETTNYGITIYGDLYIYGICLKAQDGINYTLASSEIRVIFEQCVLWNNSTQSRRFNLGDTGVDAQPYYLINCMLKWNEATTFVYGVRIFSFDMDGGEIVCSPGINDLAHCSGPGRIKFRGVEMLAAMDTNSRLGNSASGGQLTVDRCTVHADFAIATPATMAPGSVLKVENSSAATGITESVQDLIHATEQGALSLETTVVRTGGADDGDAGLFAYALDLHADACMARVLGYPAPELHSWIEGDGTTAKKITVFFCNDAAEDTGNLFTDEEVWAQVFYPSGSGTTKCEHVITRPRPGVTAAAIATDSSTWGTGGNNKQKIVITLDGSPFPIPDYAGPVTLVFTYGKRHATPPTLFLDPAMLIEDV